MRRLTYQLATECSGPSGEPTPLSGFSLQEAALWAPSLSLVTLRSLLLLLVSAPSASALIL